MDEPIDPLKACEAQRDEYLNGWKRAAADLANYKKDEGRRFEEFSQYAALKLVQEVLPVLDSFAALERSGQANEGTAAIKKQLEDFLKKQNVERIQVSPGQAVDLSLHEPVAGEEGNIIEELAPGYKLNGKVIRAAKVKVGR